MLLPFILRIRFPRNLESIYIYIYMSINVCVCVCARRCACICRCRRGSAFLVVVGVCVHVCAVTSHVLLS